jgi:hypothetical protein
MRKFALSIAVLLVLSLGALAAYDFLHFMPYTRRAKEIVASLDASDWPNDDFEKLWRGSVSRCWSAHLLYNEVYSSEKPSPGEWKRIYSLWCFLASVHLSDRERLGLYLKLTPIGKNKKGIVTAASERFGKRLAEITIEQGALLIALAHAPSYYLDKPEELQRMSENLLRKHRG